MNADFSHLPDLEPETFDEPPEPMTAAEIEELQDWQQWMTGTGKYAPNLRDKEEQTGVRQVIWHSHELMTADLPDVEMLIPGIDLPIGGSMIVAGPPASLKSWLAKDMAICTSPGLKFLGEYRCRKAHVLYIDEEGSVISTGERHNALRRGHDIHPNVPNRLTFLIKAGVRLDLDRDIDNLIDVVWNLDIDVILFDSLIRMHRGDENSAKDMAVVSQNLNRLMAETGIAVVLIQHTRKRFHGAPQRESVRGSSEITAWPDCVVACERRGQTSLLRCLKNRHGEEWAPIAWNLKVGNGVATLTKADRTALDFTELRRLEVRDLFVGLMSDGQERSRQTLIEYGREAGYGRRLCVGTLESLVEEGVLRKERRGTGGAFWYRLVPTQASLPLDD